MDTMQTIWAVIQAALKYPLVRGIIAGVAAAALVDYGAFRTWKQWSDARDYDWAVASWRWVQGAIIGGLAGLGLGSVS